MIPLQSIDYTTKLDDYPSSNPDRTLEPTEPCTTDRTEAIEPCTRRSLTDLATCGASFAQTGQEKEKAEFQSFKVKINKTFVEQTIAFSNWWNELDTQVRESLTSIDLFYWPIATAYKLTKLTPENLQELIEKVQQISDGEILVANYIEKVIKELTPKKKTKLTLDENLTQEGWILLEKKVKLDLSDFKQPNITTDEILNQLATQGLEEKASTLLPPKDQLKRERQKREEAEAEAIHWQEEYTKLQARIEELNLPIAKEDAPEAIEIEATEIEENLEEILMIASEDEPETAPLIGSLRDRSDREDHHIETDQPKPLDTQEDNSNKNKPQKQPENDIDFSNPEIQELCKKLMGCSIKSIDREITGKVCSFKGGRIQARVITPDGRKTVDWFTPDELLFKPQQIGAQYEGFPGILNTLSLPQPKTKFTDPFDPKRVGKVKAPEKKGFAAAAIAKQIL